MRNAVIRWLLIIMVAVPFWWLLIDVDPGVAPPKSVHIAELRTLAAILPGHRPTAVTYTILAKRSVVGDYYVAGSGLRLRPMVLIAWTLPVPGAGPVMIDPGGRFADVDHAAQARIDRQAKTASLILYTQGHPSERPLPMFQLGKAGISTSRPAASAQPASYTTAQAVAPGLVVIPTPGLGLGARLIFVQLADGREFLFAGNIAPFHGNWADLRAFSHLAAIWDRTQDRSETYAWLRTIRQLASEAPNMKIVPGNDFVWLMKQQAGRVITKAPLNVASAAPAS